MIVKQVRRQSPSLWVRGEFKQLPNKFMTLASVHHPHLHRGAGLPVQISSQAAWWTNSPLALMYGLRMRLAQSGAAGSSPRRGSRGD